MKNRLAVTGLGLWGPVGHSPLAAFHAVRSGITRLSVQPFPDRVQEWIVGGRVLTWIPFGRRRRLQYLAELALRDAWEGGRSSEPTNVALRWALLLTAPEAGRPGYSFPGADFDGVAWAVSLGLPSPGHVEQFPAGACSAQLALLRAGELLESGEISQCLIGGADSGLQIEVIRWYEKFYRLKCSYMTDGLLPGEASCFLRVERRQAAVDRGAAVYAEVLGVDSHDESATILSSQPNTASGLTAAVKGALREASASPKNLDAVWCDLNGESYRGREWAFVEMRLGVETHTELYHPADCHGDLGAVTDVNLLALAAMSQATGWAHGKPLLVFTGSEGGKRVATVVGPPPDQPAAYLPLPVTEGEPRTVDTRYRVAPLGADEVDPAESENPARDYFDWHLRREHLEELASLYYQRRAVLLDPEISWLRVVEPEQRMLNHLDAVLAGGATSIWSVASGLLSEEEGICFAGALVLAVLPSEDNLSQIEASLTPPIPARLRAVEEALRHVRPAEIAGLLTRWLGHVSPAVQTMAVNLLGELQLGEPSQLYPFLQSSDPALVKAALQALRRRWDVYSASEIAGLLQHPDPGVAHEAALTTLCWRSPVATDWLREQLRRGAPAELRAEFLLALAGDPSDVEWLLRNLPAQALYRPTTLEALGIFGCTDAVDLLLAALRNENDLVREAAARALDLITGAGLREEVSVPDPEVPEIVHEVVRTSTSLKAWSPWWSSNASRLPRGRRWRRGQPFGPDACVEELANPLTPLASRRRAHWELLIHTGIPVAYEPDWFVRRQQRALERWRQWKQSAGQPNAPEKST